MNRETILYLYREFELATTPEIALAANARRNAVELAIGAINAERRDERERQERKQNQFVNMAQVNLMRKRLNQIREAA